MTRYSALVTGGTGFVGSRIVAALLADGAEVRILSSAQTDRSRLDSLGDHLQWFGMSDAEIYLATRDIDCFFNMAVVYDRPTVDDALMEEVNVGLPLRVMDKLRGQAQRVTCVLGDSFFRKFPPRATRQHRYTTSKARLMQRLTSDPSLIEPNLRVAFLQIEQVYGPGEAFTKVFPQLTRLMLENVPRLPTTHGLQRRDFVHVGDVAAAAMCIAKGDDWRGLQNAECGSGVSTSVREVVERLKILAGSETELGFGDLAPDQSIDESFADLRWLNKQGWSPRTPLGVGLAELVTDVASRLAAKAP